MPKRLIVLLLAAAAAALPAAAAERLDVSVTAKCNKGKPVFLIFNRGERWPAPGTLRLYRTADKQMVAERSLVMAKGQSASFTLGRVEHKVGEVALRIEPTWYERPATDDAVKRCEETE